METLVYKFALLLGQPPQWHPDSFGKTRRGTSVAYIQRLWALDVSKTLRSSHIISAWKMCQHGDVRKYLKGWLRFVAFTEPGVHAEHRSTEFVMHLDPPHVSAKIVLFWSHYWTMSSWFWSMNRQVEAPIHRSSWQQFSSNVASHVNVNRSNFPSVMQSHMQTLGRKSLHMNGISRVWATDEFWSM